MADPINRLAMYAMPVSDDQVNRLAPAPLPPGHPSNMLRSVRDWIPENRDLPAPQFPFDPRSLSMANMLRAGLGTAANWLEGTSNPNAIEIGPDTASPLGLMGMAGIAGRGATAARVLADNAKSSLPGTVVQGLDLSQEARLARAQEQGFDTGTTYYHGTDRPIGEFQSFPGTYGSGVYMTPDASVASRYSERPHGYVADAPGAATGPSVLPLHVRGKLASPDELSDAFRPIYDRGDISYSQAMQEAMNTLRDRGYSGANHGAGDTLVFDPSNIRSPQAAFDPAKRDSANLLAANPSASSPGLAANATQEDSPVLDILSKYGLY